MRVAVIDLGTNTFNLLISDIESGIPKKVFKTKISVKLGEGGFSSNKITPAASDRAISALLAFRRIIGSFKTNKIFAHATSAVRNATNGKKFVKEIKDKVGFNVSIITGVQEAEYVYYGVKRAYDFTEENCLLMDIGGGSTEFVICDDERAKFKKSYDLGVSRLNEMFKFSDPILPQEIKKLHNYLDEQLGLLNEHNQNNSCKTLIGSSGSFDCLSKIIIEKGHKLTPVKEKFSYLFDKKILQITHQELVKSNRKQREAIKGIPPDRIDTIVMASILIDYVVNKLNINEIVLSKFAMKDGVITKLAEREI